MKLQRVNKYVAGVTASLMLFLGAGCSVTNEIEDTVVSDTYIEEVVEPVIRNFVIPSDDEIENEISNYSDLDTTRYMSNMYKVLEISDSDQYYKVMIVGTRVEYITLEGNIIGNKYTVFDLLSKNDLFTTSNLDTFEDMEPISDYFINSRVISYSSIKELSSIARCMGASESYISEVMKNTKQISERELAAMYISLIPSSCRVNLNKFEYNDVKKIG